MPYKRLADLPENTKNLPTHAKEIYKEAYNSAYRQYKNPESRKDHDDLETTAAKVAWSAVKTKYRKNQSGDWVADES